jgi:hypothetical protein
VTRDTTIIDARRWPPDSCATVIGADRRDGDDGNRRARSDGPEAFLGGQKCFTAAIAEVYRKVATPSLLALRLLMEIVFPSAPLVGNVSRIELHGSLSGRPETETGGLSAGGPEF